MFIADHSRRNFLLGLSGLAVSSVSAHANALGPSGRVVYAAMDLVPDDPLPRGRVEAYRVHARTGKRTLLGRQPLSLSATDPRSLALSPDGKYLVVACYGSGIYNVLPIEAEGAPGPVCGIFKELGGGHHPEHQRSAHPHSLRFHPSGAHFYATDLGCDRISVFALENGRLKRSARCCTPPGSGPGRFTLHGDGTLLRVEHELARTNGSYRFQNGVLSADRLTLFG